MHLIQMMNIQKLKIMKTSQEKYGITISLKPESINIGSFSIFVFHNMLQNYLENLLLLIDLFLSYYRRPESLNLKSQKKLMEQV